MLVLRGWCCLVLLVLLAGSACEGLVGPSSPVLPWRGEEGQGEEAAVRKQLDVSSLLSDGVVPLFGDPLFLISLASAPPQRFFTDPSSFSTLEAILVDVPFTGPARFPVPSQLGLFCKLNMLLLRRYFQGTIPTQVGLLSNLRLWDVSSGLVGGQLPTQLGQMTNLITLFAFNSKHTGTIPSQLGLTRLAIIRAFSNQLSGTLPSELLTPGLYDLDVGDNLIEGTLPTQLWRLPIMGRVLVYDCRLSGTLPTEIGLATSVLFFGFHGNRFSGTLPTQMGLLTASRLITLHRNQFSGSFPSEIARLQGLRALDVSFNRLGGTLPTQLGLMAGLTRLDVGHNAFVGTVPLVVLKGLSALNDVGLADNRLEGTVPDEYAAVWLGQCDFSGLVQEGCKVACEECDWSELELRGCDSKGSPPVCLPVFGAVVAVGMVAALVVALVSRLNKRVPRRSLAMIWAGATYSVVDMFTDILFALGSSGLIQALSVASLVVIVAANIAVTVWILKTTPELKGGLRVCAACVLVVLHPASLQSAMQSPQGKDLACNQTIFVTVAEGLAQGCLQGLSILLGNASTVNIVALAFSVSTVASLSAVYGIIHISQRSLPANQRLSDVSIAAVVRLYNATHAEGGGDPGQSGGRDARNQEQNVVEEDDDDGRKASAAAESDEAVESGPRDVEESGPRDVEERAGGGQRRDEDRGDDGSTRQRGSQSSRSSVRLAMASVSVCCVAATVVLWSGGGDPRVPQSALVSNQLDTRELTQTSWAPRTERIPAAPKALDCSTPSASSLQLPLMYVLGYALAVFVVGDPEAQTVSILSDHPTIQFASVSDISYPLPSQFGLLSNLLFLFVEGCPGNLPSQMGLLEKLLYLEVTTRTMTGTLPSESGLLSSLDHFRLSNTALGGTIPPSLSQLPLASFGLEGNANLEGAVSVGFPPNERLSNVVVTGSPGLLVVLASEIGLARNITVLSLESVRVGTAIPSQLSLLSSLTTLELCGVGLVGELVVSEAWRAGLETLSLCNNQLRGTLPTTLGLLTMLQRLDVGNNGLSGTLPTQLALLTRLTHLDFGSNELTGTVPREFSGLRALATVVIEDNALSGRLPMSFSADQRELWLAECEHSGVVEGRQCARECARCAYAGVELVPCNRRGFSNVCLPLWGMVCIAVVCMGVVGMAVKKIAPRKLSKRRLVLMSVASTLVGFHWLVDLAFALSSPTATRAAALLIISVSALLRFVLSTAEFLRMQLERRQSDIKVRSFVFALAIVFCILDPFTLRVVTSTDVHLMSDMRLARYLLERRWLKTKLTLVVLLSDLPLLSLQLARLAGAPGSTLPALAVAMTCVSLLLLGREANAALNKRSKKMRSKTAKQMEMVSWSWGSTSLF